MRDPFPTSSAVQCALAQPPEAVPALHRVPVQIASEGLQELLAMITASPHYKLHGPIPVPVGQRKNA